MKNQTSVAKTPSKKTTVSLAKAPGPVIWALDPSYLNEEQIKKMQGFQKIWTGKNQETLITSIFIPYDLGLMVKVKKSLMLSTINEVQKALIKKVAPLGLPGEKIKLLAAPTNSLRDRVLTLIDFAKKKKSEVILVASQAKSRTKITGLGSFAESLISLSEKPVLVVGENVEAARPVSKILFPSDFSESSFGVFKNVLKFAKKFNAEVIIYHYMDLDSGPIAFGIPWGFDITWIDEYWQNHAEIIEKESAKWIEFAKQSLGIKCKFISDRKLGGLSDCMLKCAEAEKADVLALGVKRGPWSQVILGRIVRNLFADAKVPVLVMHSQMKTSKQQAKPTYHS